MMGTTIPVVISVYNDRSFDFVLKSPPAAVLLKKAASIAKGSSNPLKNKVGTVTSAQLEEIAKQKFNDLNSDFEYRIIFNGTVLSHQQKVVEAIQAINS